MKQNGIAHAMNQPAPQQQDIERNFQALREQKERLEKENQEIRQNMAFMRDSFQKQPEPMQKRLNPLDELDAEEALPTSVYRTREQELLARLDLQEKEMLGLRNSIKYPDYHDVVDNFAAPLIKQNPNFAAGFYAAPDPYGYAYELGKMAKERKQETQPTAYMPPPVQAPTQHPYAQRILDNSRKPGSISGAGGQGSFHEVVNWATMSDEEFDKRYAEMNK
jgi:hypothetical protein